MKFIIVENQKKQQTYANILKQDKENRYRIFSTGGYIVKIRDSSSKLGWIPNDQSKTFLDKIIFAIKEKNDNSETEVYIATDDDENGERLAWDIFEYLDYPNTTRISCRELNLYSIKEALKHGRAIDKNRINAQITRRSVEGIIGNSISKLMRWWFKKEELITDKKILDKIGIGRVSAPALSLIVQAEESIDTFIPEYYKRVAIDYFINDTSFTVKNKLKWKQDKKEELMTFFRMVKTQEHVVYKFDRNTKDRTPPSPLNAIWLQRAASYQFGYSPKKTMSIAKELYEGIDIGESRIGLITYPKTDSTYIGDEAIYEIIQLILKSYGEKYVFQSRRIYKNTMSIKDEEAIRPLSFKKEYFPDKIKKYLTQEQYAIYKFIYQRTLATQMNAAIYDQSELVVQVGGSEFKATANKMLFDGWKLIGKFWKDDEQDDYEEVTLPEELIPGEIIKPLDIRVYEVKERSPWRYGEGRFITALQSHNIANASSTADITYYLKNKGYITIQKSMIYPTELGKSIHYFISEFVPWIINLEYLAKFENDILLVEKGEKKAEEVILEYETLRNETQLKLNYDEDGLPEKWLVEKVKKIATQNGQTLKQEMLSSRKRLLFFLKENSEESKTIGTCPQCKKGEIYKTEHGYKCNNSNCFFILWQNNIDNFLHNFNKDISKDMQKEYLSIIFKKGRCFIHNLYSSKKDKFFDSYISLEYNNKYKNWSISLAQYNDKEEQNFKDYMPDADKIEEEKKEKILKVYQGKEKKLERENEELIQRIKQEKKERRLLLDNMIKDPMTRAYNRGCFDKDIQKILEKEKDISICFIDGDKFKNVNDTYGHQAGDLVLQFLANKMFTGIRDIKRARIYRYGGEEFIIIFINETKKTVIDCINSIRQSIENEKVTHEDIKIPITISAGVSFLRDNDTVEELIKRADNAVYRAKENGRNRIEIER